VSYTIPRLFLLIRARGTWLVPGLKKVKISRCKVADSEHEGRWRQFMHYGHEDRTVCYAKAAEDLEPEWKIGLIAHELGHATADLLGIMNHSEEDANRLGSSILGEKVEYKGDHRLEWAPVPEWLAERISWEGRSPRHSGRRSS
jgi:hypothetical protein